jgi:hypothetical protein
MTAMTLVPRNKSLAWIGPIPYSLRVLLVGHATTAAAGRALRPVNPAG